MQWATLPTPLRLCSDYEMTVFCTVSCPQANPRSISLSLESLRVASAPFLFITLAVRRGCTVLLHAQAQTFPSSSYLEYLLCLLSLLFPHLLGFPKAICVLTSWIQFSSAVKVNLVNTAGTVYAGLHWRGNSDGEAQAFPCLSNISLDALTFQ